ncbi:hypothetical protein HM131_19525 [Halobacillus mangrovi]|uniref:Uncharacterized protein n=1 Tax=Halobacillus mangrovi TaxID=402384 RepID=A0A1W6A035_9BACI|nr:hypothetical protein HM131_19525 [Halobacillus mangrovi]
MGPFITLHMGWMENDETPAGEGPRRDPTGSAANEEACQFPPQESESFSSQPYAYYVTAPRISRIQVFKIRRQLWKRTDLIKVKKKLKIFTNKC